MKLTILRLSRSFLVIILLSVSWAQAHADPLPIVNNVRIVGDQLTWDAVEGATGYNISLRGYLATVRDGLTFPLTELGSYRVSAFDDNGNFSPASRSTFFSSGVDNRPRVTIRAGDAAYFFTRCFDINAGETCTARCPDLAVGPEGRFVIGAPTGGACSSSGTDFVSAQLGPDEYSCTVSSFTARVEAQVACRSTPVTQ